MLDEFWEIMRIPSEVIFFIAPAAIDFAFDAVEFIIGRTLQ